MVSAPGLTFASAIAWRNDPAPLLLAFVTVSAVSAGAAKVRSIDTAPMATSAAIATATAAATANRATRVIALHMVVSVYAQPASNEQFQRTALLPVGEWQVDIPRSRRTRQLRHRQIDRDALRHH